MSQPSKDAETTPMEAPDDTPLANATSTSGSDDAAPPPAEEHTTDGLRHDDPFRLGWHTLSHDLIQKYAAQPLPRPPEEDFQNTVPPGGALKAPDGNAAPEAQPSEPIELPLVPRKRWPLALLAGGVVAAAVGWLVLRGEEPSTHLAPPRKSPEPSTPAAIAPPSSDDQAEAPGAAQAVDAAPPMPITPDPPTDAETSSKPSAPVSTNTDASARPSPQATEQRARPASARDARSSSKSSSTPSPAKPSEKQPDLFPALD